MIEHMYHTWGKQIFFPAKRSVLPKAGRVAFLCGVLAAAMSVATKYNGVSLLPEQNTFLGELWSSFSFVLGFLIVFRTNQAYSRYWEGATLIHQIRGEWYNAFSSVISFCSVDESKQQDVNIFQQKLIRLASMLFCCALHQVCDSDDDSIEVINNGELSSDHLKFLYFSCNDRCEIVLHWLQRHIIHGSRTSLIDVPPPILSRVYQELGRGMVNLNNVRKIKEVPFPYPLDQLILLLLCLHFVATSFFASESTDTPWAAAGTAFIISLAYWALCYIAVEIQQPFGKGYSDISVENMQVDFNNSLWFLMNPLTTSIPSFDVRETANARNSVIVEKVSAEGPAETEGDRSRTLVERSIEKTRSMGRSRMTIRRGNIAATDDSLHSADSISSDDEHFSAHDSDPIRPRTSFREELAETSRTNGKAVGEANNDASKESQKCGDGPTEDEATGCQATKNRSRGLPIDSADSTNAPKNGQRQL
eukprot:TRINITY_DN19545_c1_g2_i1.p1 TRINITY_DN19545_c1_g2~~TRINITY_DN19545_c1_g2_i1.p1  ORF type:complete len:507 (+),score=37.68 TRINITY_DN19545_c1_g2_i1:92-1522(+)